MEGEMENRIKEEAADSPKSVLEEEVCFFFRSRLYYYYYYYYFGGDTVPCFSCSFTCPISTSVRVSGGLSSSLFYHRNEDLFGTC